jgi:hypothetical protein
MVFTHLAQPFTGAARQQAEVSPTWDDACITDGIDQPVEQVRRGSLEKPKPFLL